MYENVVFVKLLDKKLKIMMKSKKKFDVYFGKYSLNKKIFNNVFSLSADNEAVDVKWEVIDDDQEIETHKPTDKDPLGIKIVLHLSISFILLCFKNIQIYLVVLLVNPMKKKHLKKVN